MSVVESLGVDVAHTDAPERADISRECADEFVETFDLDGEFGFLEQLCLQDELVQIHRMCNESGRQRPQNWEDRLQGASELRMLAIKMYQVSVERSTLHALWALHFVDYGQVSSIPGHLREQVVESAANILITLSSIFLMRDDPRNASRTTILGLEVLKELPETETLRVLQSKLLARQGFARSKIPEYCDNQTGSEARRRGGQAPVVVHEPTPPVSRGLSVWRRVSSLRSNRVLLQAFAVPLRQIFAFMGFAMCVRGQVSWRTSAFALCLWPFSGLGVTAGAHRLWTHASYRPSRFMECLILLMYSVADQGPICGWALTHALHHRASDTDGDPHNRSAGFWHAHFGWLFSSKCFQVCPEDYDRIVQSHSKLVKFHDSCCAWWGPMWSLAMPTAVAACWGEAKAGFFVAGAMRWAFVQHVTFFVNSVAHGERDEDSKFAFDPGATGIGPRVSLLVTILALGEGWHDYHHLFPWDYAAAELGSWDQWNPTKAFIDLFAALGLCEGRRRCSDSMQLLRRSQLTGKSCRSDEFKVVGLPFLRCRVPVEVPLAPATEIPADVSVRLSL
uniref:Fatty acid desaturase domain-containing protein n=1 Tax=Noctiluca scintillans TaxID=2966 RepID=A0A7S1A7U5_NOCSC|mmetsp:Transcript_34136/g.91088  ORF Transcript_34136/g.91088 Transcript_34136/m.91088 type:complete len:563 (+) Transcript_34136:65-1753(+)